MSGISAGLYARWCSGGRPAPDAAVHEGGSPPERWLQQIWRHQRVRRDALLTSDGRPIQVLHPGFWNREPGPDFRDAVLQIGGGTPSVGDVEIDVNAGGWEGHGHAGNPAYSRVVLQVIWETGHRRVDRPVLALKPVLDCPIGDLGPWLEEEAAATLPFSTPGRCCGPLRTVAAEAAAGLLDQAAAWRLERKVAEFTARARHLGWEPVLWEALFSALGYKHNAWPMRRLAELVKPAATTGRESIDVLEARLLGLAGWLPVDLPAGAAADHARSLWDIWWRERDVWSEWILPASVWRRAGIRPANHPQRRLALAAHWMASGDLVNRLERIFLRDDTVELNPTELTRQLMPDDGAGNGQFWRQHWTFQSGVPIHPVPLLGPARATDLAINAILPWLISRARTGRDLGLVARLELQWFEWPVGQDNADLRFARRRLWAGTPKGIRWTAARQQGLLQIRRDFCLPAGALCSGCRFPGLVEGSGL